MRNPDTRHPNRNTLYLARSGGGKSQALKQNPMIPKRGARVVLWDPNEDHPCHGYSRMGDFLRALAKADRHSKTKGGGFRIGYTGPDTLEAYLDWCVACMTILDGRILTYLIVEELSTVSPHAGKAPPPAAKMMNQIRKYGGIFHGTSQKAQEISKTYFDQCEHLWIGAQKTQRQRRLVAEEIGKTPEEIAALQPLEFYHDNGKEVVFKKLNYLDTFTA